jgi:hypothetical protein
MDGEAEFVDCSCYTQARRHPEVLGTVGSSVLPVQITAPALLAGVGTFLAMVFGWVLGVWGWLFPTPFAAALCVVAPLAVGWCAQVTKVEGRSPLVAAASWIRYGLRSRGGVVAGRPLRHRRRCRLVDRVPVSGGVR